MKFAKKIINIIEKEFDSKPVYNEKYLNTKIKSQNEKLNTNFCNNKIPNENSQCIFLSVILIDSVYPQVFLEECKYFVKKKRFLSLLITDDIEISFDDSDRENYDEENSNEEN